MFFSLSKNIVLHVCIDLIFIVIWMSMLLIITVAKKKMYNSLKSYTMITHNITCTVLLFAIVVRTIILNVQVCFIVQNTAELFGSSKKELVGICNIELYKSSPSVIDQELQPNTAFLTIPQQYKL